MKHLQRFSGFILSIAMILILMVTAFDLAVYGDLSFFQTEYEKYDVLDDLNMEMDDVMEVTHHMMEYLRGGNDDMQIRTTVAGQERNFFNGQDLFHMEEVRNIFLAVYQIRTIALIAAAVSLAVLIGTKTKIKTIFLCFQGCLGIFFGVIAALGIIVAVNFSKAFVIFHHIFFDNDLWLFDPSTDLMINMLPEGLFMDFSVRILVTFALLLAVFEGLLLLIRRWDKKRSLTQAGKAAAFALLFALGTTAMTEPVMAADLYVPAVSADTQQLGLTADASHLVSLQDDLTGLPDWPVAPSVKADAAILIDARTGNILYGKNEHQAYPPASITKILTALIACEKGNLNDTVVFSHNAVYDLPWDSSIVGFSEDERVNLKDALYGLLLKSGNEAANGIAEHIAGSTTAFAEMMNQRAVQAGATNSNFVNPHGLHDSKHFTTAHDMAMILRDAVKNDAFLQIASTSYYEIEPTNISKDGYRFSAGHRMINKNRNEYYEYAVAGKTGYTSKAGNTLVTYAKKDNMELICVILHSSQTQYSDTRTLFDYGFSNFTCYNAAVEDHTYGGERIGFFSFLGSAFEKNQISVNLDDCYIILPSTIPFSSLTSQLEYSKADASDSGSNLLGYVSYAYKGIQVGRTGLRMTGVLSDPAGSGIARPGSTNTGTEFPDTDESSGVQNQPQAPEDDKKVVALNVWHLFGYIFLGVLAVVIAVISFRYFSAKERRARKVRKLRRLSVRDGQPRRKKRKKELR